MSKSKFVFVIAGLVAGIGIGAAQQVHDQSFMHVWQGMAVAYHQDKSTHHAAMHAEHWLDHHTSAPHGKAYRHRAAKRKHNFNHAVKHTEHWIDHHVSAPHKHQ